MNHCWSLFGTTGRLALAIGLHRRWRREAINDHVESECRKRVFWCAYSLDIYLSAALGRPKIFHDEDIDQVSDLALILVAFLIIKSTFRRARVIVKSQEAQYYRIFPMAKISC